MQLRFFFRPLGSRCLGFRVSGLGFRVSGLGFRVLGLGFRGGQGTELSPKLIPNPFKGPVEAPLQERITGACRDMYISTYMYVRR